MSLRILITGTTGDSMPPPYAGIPNVSLLYARTWRKTGHTVGMTFVYKPDNADDLGAGAEYFFEYGSKPNKFKKALFLLKYFVYNPLLYFVLLRKYMRVCPRLTTEVVLYSAYGVHIDSVLASFKPDIILSQAALIKTFMVSEVAQRRGIPVVFNTYAEVHDLAMGVNKHLNEKEREKYWTYFLNLSALVIGMDNCSVGPLMYLPQERVKVFYDTCDFNSYQIDIPETKEEMRTFLGLPPQQFLAGMMGAFHYRKGHDHLIRAVALLREEGLDIGAMIVGGAVGMEKWQKLARDEGVEDHIYFGQNFRETKKIRLHRSLDVYCNFSNSPRSCGLDLALLEAMACGAPIVVYDNGALPSAVPGQENGFLVETDNIVGIADALRKMYNLSTEKRKEMGEKSRVLAEKTDINKTAEIKIGWFKTILENAKK